jgi:hypothetical protein
MPETSISDTGFSLSFAAATAGIVFSAYLPTIFLSVPGGDSGELLSEACQLGVAHPPGYPLFIYFSRAAMALLPAALGSPARRANLASAALGAAAAALLHLAAARLSRRLPAAWARPLPAWAVHAACAGAAISWALSPLVWLYHVGVEVFALNNFFVCALLLAGAAFADVVESEAAAVAAGGASDCGTDEDRARGALGRIVSAAGAVSFLCGLSLCNQHTSLLFIAPLAGWIAATLFPALLLRESLRADGGGTVRAPVAALALRAAALAGAGFAGLLPYAHLPLAHTFWRGPGTWGDSSTLGGFFRHFTRADYGTFRLLAREGATETPLARTREYVRNLRELQLPTGALLALPLVVAAATLFAQPLGALFSAAAAAPRRGAGRDVARGAAGNALAFAARSAGAAPAALLPAALAFYFLVFHGLSNMPLGDPLLYGVHARFWMQPNALVFCMVGVGACWAAALALGAAGTACGGGGGVLFFLLRTAAGALACAGAAGAAWMQHARWRRALDHSRNDVLAQYGRALLEPLPLNATLVTSYDMQWTAVRYLQTCEGVRRDVALLNGPVLSYKWFASSRQAYPGLVFPGTHMVPAFTAPHAAGGFSFADFAAANLAPDCGRALALSYTVDPPHVAFAGAPRDVVGGGFTLPANASAVEELGGRGGPRACGPRSGGAGSGGVFFAGSLAGAANSDKAPPFADAFDTVPHGAVTRVALRAEQLPRGGPQWRQLGGEGGGGARAPAPASRGEVDAARAAWAAATARFTGDVDPAFFDGSTWEAATRVEFWTQGRGYATWLLEWATAGGEDAADVPLVAEAAAVLERAVLMTGAPDAFTLKNLGLAYVKLVRAPAPLLPGAPAGDSAGLPVLPAVRLRARAAGINESGLSSGPPTWGLSPGLVSENDWRAKAAERVLETWGVYLASREAAADPGRESIAAVVRVLRSAAAGKAPAEAVTGGATEGAKRRRKEK